MCCGGLLQPVAQQDANANADASGKLHPLDLSVLEAFATSPDYYAFDTPSQASVSDIDFSSASSDAYAEQIAADLDTLNLPELSSPEALMVAKRSPCSDDGFDDGYTAAKRACTIDDFPPTVDVAAPAGDNPLMSAHPFTMQTMDLGQVDMRSCKPTRATEPSSRRSHSSLQSRAFRHPSSVVRHPSHSNFPRALHVADPHMQCMPMPVAAGGVPGCPMCLEPGASRRKSRCLGMDKKVCAACAELVRDKVGSFVKSCGQRDRFEDYVQQRIDRKKLQSKSIPKLKRCCALLCQDSAKKFGDLTPSELAMLKHPARTNIKAEGSVKARRRRQRSRDHSLDHSSAPPMQMASPESSDSSAQMTDVFVATLQMEGDLCMQASLEKWLQSKTLGVSVRGVNIGLGPDASSKSQLGACLRLRTPLPPGPSQHRAALVIALCRTHLYTFPPLTFVIADGPCAALDVRGSKQRVEASIEELQSYADLRVHVIEEPRPLSSSPELEDSAHPETVVGSDCYYAPTNGNKESAVHLVFRGDIMSAKFFSRSMVKLWECTKRNGVGAYFTSSFLNIAENPFDTSSLDFCVLGPKAAVATAWQELMMLAMDSSGDGNISCFMDQQVPAKLLRA